MTLEQIKSLMPYFTRWMEDISLLYGIEYAKMYCTWNRFRDHLEIMSELKGDMSSLAPQSILEEVAKEVFHG